MFETEDPITGDGTDRAIRREQAKANAATAKITLRAQYLTTFGAALTIWHATGGLPILAWMGVLWIASAVRLAEIARYERTGVLEADPDRALRRSWQNSILHGVLWGLVPVMAFDGEPSGPLAFVGFLIAGSTAGSTIQSRSYAPAGIAFIVPTLVGFIGYCLSVATAPALILATLTLLMMTLMIQNVRESERAFRAMHRARIEATRLAASLEKARAEAEAAREQLAVIAGTDALTGLSNRGAFNAALADACAAGGRFALLVLDLDRFKLVNDTWGHPAGDRLLIEVAGRLRAGLGTGDRAARLGGDEFAVIVADPDALPAVADALLSALRRPVDLGDRPVTVGGSIGAAVFPDDGRTGAELFARADAALYAAKEGGRHRWRAFSADLGARLAMRRRIEQDLPGALLRGELAVHVQPIVALRHAAVTGFEALIRWNHPALGWIAPPEIVDTAAALGISDRLTSAVVEAACRIVHALDQRGLPDAVVAVNVSPREFAAYCPATLIRSIVDRHGVPARRIEVEITEESLLDTVGRQAELERLEASGLRVALDDFGAGHASLVYLAALRVDRIKIDRRFVASVAGTARERAVVEAIVGVGRVLGLGVVAEGVETAAELAALAELGCTEVQGALLGCPMPEAEVGRWLDAWPSGPARTLLGSRPPLSLAGE